MTEIPETSPYYLTVNQSKNCAPELIIHPGTPSLTLSSKILPKVFRSFEHELPVFLACPCSERHTFLLHDPGVSRLVLLGISRLVLLGISERTQAWFNENKGQT